MRRIVNAYQVELLKALHLKSTYLGLGLVAAAVLSAPLLHPLTRDGRSDYAFIAFVTPATLNLLGLVLLLAWCAGLVCTEVSSGTVRLVLVRPLRRWEFLAAKLLLGMTYAATLGVLVACLAWGLAFFFGDLGGVGYGGELLYTGAEVFRTYLTGFLVELLPLSAAVAYAVMISTLTRSATAAITAALGLWLVLDAIKYPLGIAPYLFTTYFETPWQPFLTQVSDGQAAPWFPETAYCIAVSAAYAVTFVTAAMLVFRRRNLHA